MSAVRFAMGSILVLTILMGFLWFDHTKDMRKIFKITLQSKQIDQSGRASQSEIADMEKSIILRDIFGNMIPFDSRHADIIPTVPGYVKSISIRHPNSEIVGTIMSPGGRSEVFRISHQGGVVVYDIETLLPGYTSYYAGIVRMFKK